MKEFFKVEWGKLREMSFKDKRQYIWEYYKLHLLGFAVAAFVLGSIINNVFINPPKYEYLYIAWAGIPAMPWILDELSQGLTVIVEDPERQTVFISDYSETGNPQMDMAVMTRFMALLQTASIDAFITTGGGIEELAEEGFIRPVHDILDAFAAINPTMEIGDRFLSIYHHPWYSEEPVSDVLGISLAGSPFIEYFGISTDDMYLAVIGNATRFENIAKALEVFLYGA